MKKYIWNILISFDQFVNTLFGGDMDETISSRLGKWARANKHTKGIKAPIYFVANFVVELFERNHFAKSIEDDEGKDEVLK